MNKQSSHYGLTLVIGGTGKTGRRVAERLEQMGREVRIGSRSSVPSFDWDREESWSAALDGVTNLYITYSPDLAMPGAADAIQALVQRAKQAGAKRLVLLSGRGEEEAQACEQIVIESGLEWTVVRASWFNQNFSEGAFNDIADVAVAALTEDGHNGEIYEVTGPRLMTMVDIAADLSNAAGRQIAYVDVPHSAFIDEITNSGAPKEVVWMLDYLFSAVLDGRNAHLTDGVQRALGRLPKDFADYAKETAATGVWRAAA